MKKISLILVALFMALSLGLAGCGVEHRGPGTPGNQPGTPSGPGQENPPIVDPSDDEDVFTVKLVCNGVTVVPEEGIYALWTEENGYAVHRAAFDRKTGVAKISGLQDEYKVTLSAKPDGYTYDPNVYTADVDSKDTEIRLYRITPTTGAGDDLYAPIMLTDRGIYRASFTYPGQTVYFRYQPPYTGEYSISTMVDVTDNVINPLLDVHLGTSGYINPTPDETIDTGGPENTYTKNLVWIKQLTDKRYFLEFGIRVMAMNSNPFPLTVDFILQWEGEITNTEEPKNEEVVPTENFVQQTVPSGKTFKYVAYLDPNRLLDADMFRLWKKEDGGDGYYHFYDDITGYGDVIYAKINADTEVIATESKQGFCDGYIRCIVGNKDYGKFISAYAGYTNADGVYPVTEELQIFLQGYASGQAIFNDGNGMAERPGQTIVVNPSTGEEEDRGYFPGYNSGEHDMWLFACGYYS